MQPVSRPCAETPEACGASGASATVASRVASTGYVAAVMGQVAIAVPGRTLMKRLAAWNRMPACVSRSTRPANSVFAPEASGGRSVGTHFVVCDHHSTAQRWPATALDRRCSMMSAAASKSRPVIWARGDATTQVLNVHSASSAGGPASVKSRRVTNAWERGRKERYDPPHTSPVIASTQRRIKRAPVSCCRERPMSGIMAPTSVVSTRNTRID